jgi:NAD(P)-dependent dehydrogenase (short-subunit alcohol dehydrogenase family)
MNPGTGSIAITGASTGIGRGCAIHFAGLGHKVFAGVRSSADGDALKASSPGNIQPLLLDVTCADSVKGAAATIGDEPLAGLINNAGVAVVGPLEVVPIAAWRRQFEVNVIGLVAVTQALLPALRRGRGRIVNIGSIAGRSPLPCSGPYDASKFAVEAITDVLRMELKSMGIAVSVIEPGAVATPIWEKSLKDADELIRQAEPERYALYARLMAKLRAEAMEAARKAISVDQVVKAVEHAMTARRPKARYPVGGDTRLWLLLNALPDRWRDWLILSQMNK